MHQHAPSLTFIDTSVGSGHSSSNSPTIYTPCSSDSDATDALRTLGEVDHLERLLGTCPKRGKGSSSVAVGEATDAPPSTAAVEAYQERIRASVGKANAFETIQYPKAKLACSNLWKEFKREHMENLGKGPKTGLPFECYPAAENEFWTMLTYLVCKSGADFKQQVRINCSSTNLQESESRKRYSNLLRRFRGVPTEDATLSAVLKRLYDEEKS